MIIFPLSIQKNIFVTQQAHNNTVKTIYILTIYEKKPPEDKLLLCHDLAVVLFLNGSGTVNEHFRYHY